MPDRIGSLDHAVGGQIKIVMEVNVGEKYAIGPIEPAPDKLQKPQ